MTGPVTQTAATKYGFVGEFLTDFGLSPKLASAIGSAAVSVVVFVALYVVGRLVIVPLVDRLLEQRGWRNTLANHSDCWSPVSWSRWRSGWASR